MIDEVKECLKDVVLPPLNTNQKNIMIVGADKSGKDYVAKLLQKFFTFHGEPILSGPTTSLLCAPIVFEVAKRMRMTTKSYEEFYDNRVYMRQFWFDVIKTIHHYKPLYNVTLSLQCGNVLLGQRAAKELEDTFETGCIDLVVYCRRDQERVDTWAFTPKTFQEKFKPKHFVQVHNIDTTNALFCLTRGHGLTMKPFTGAASFVNDRGTADIVCNLRGW